MLLLQCFALFLGAKFSRAAYSEILHNNQKAIYPKGTVLPGFSSSDLQYVTVTCLNFAGYTSPIAEKFQIKIWHDDEQVNGWKEQTFRGDCSKRSVYSFPVSAGQTAGWIWVRGESLEPTDIKVHTSGKCMFNDCYNGEWVLDRKTEISLTQETDTANWSGRCIGDVGVDGDGWCELSRNAPTMRVPYQAKTVCGDITEFVLNIEHDLYAFTKGSHGWSDFSSFYWNKVPEYMTTPESYGFTLKHNYDAGTRIRLSFPENLYFNLYVIFEMEGKRRGGGFDMGEPDEFALEKLTMNGWTFLGEDEVSFYSTYFGSTRKMGLWTKQIRGRMNQDVFSLPAFTRKFTGGIVVQPVDNLYYCGKK